MTGLQDETSQEEVSTKRGPLDGLIVADLSRVLAGPYCTMLMADLGATVIKVESPWGDDTRAWTPPELNGISTYYLSINRNKRSIALDFKNPDDVALVHELYRRADIVVQNFKVGSLAKFDLDYESARAINERLVYLSISGFGAEGGAALSGYDLVVQAVAGLIDLTGSADGPGYRAGISVFDVVAGLHGLVGVLAALHQRNQTGEGQHVEVNLLSSALSGLVNDSGGFAASGVVPTRMGNEHPSLYPYQTMATADRDVVIAAGNDRQFVSLCQVLGIPEVADDVRFSRNEARTRNREELHPILAEVLATKTADELFHELNAVGVPCGPVNNIGQGVELAASLGLNPVVSVGEGSDAVNLIANPIGFSAAPPTYRLPPPSLGQHGDEIRAWLADGGD